MTVGSCTSREVKNHGTAVADYKDKRFGNNQVLKRSQSVTLRLHLQHGIQRLSVKSNIKKLDLSYKKLYKVEGLEKLRYLEELDLSYNKISDLNDFYNSPNLKWLFLYDNHISKLDNLHKFKKLKGLFIDDNPIPYGVYAKAEKEYPDIKIIGEQESDLIPRKTALRFYTRDSKKIKVVNSRLKKLYINNKKHKKYLSEWTRNKFITKTIDNKIIRIEGLDQLVNLEILSIRNTGIKYIKGLDKLKNLKKLDLYNNRLTKICLLYTSPSPRDVEESRMPSSA